MAFALSYSLPRAMEPFLDLLKKDVQCLLCNITLREPKKLPCFHTFCKICIEKHAKPLEGAQIFNCPKCLSKTSLDELKPSLLHARILKVVNFAECKKGCSVCTSHSLPSWFCFECDKSLCSECYKNHATFTRHEVASLTKLKRKDLEFMLSKASHCKEHKQVSDFFCKECDKSICTSCFKTRGCYAHHTVPWDQHNSIIRTTMVEKVGKLRLKSEEMDKKVRKMKDIAKKSQQNANKAKKDIRRTVEQHIASIKNKEKQLLKQIDQGMENLEKMKARQECEAGKVQGAVEYFTKSMERNLASEVYSSTYDMETSDIFPDVSVDEFSEVSIEFAPNREFTDYVKNTELGTIETPIPAARTAKAETTFETQKSKNNLNDLNIKINSEEADKPGKKCVQAKNENRNVVDTKCGAAAAPVKEMKVFSKFIMKGLKKQPERLSGIAVNKENSKIAVVDYSSHCVNIFNRGGDLLKTYGGRGNGEGKLSSPQGLAFLSEEELVIADTGNDRICIINTTTGRLTKAFGSKENEGLVNPRGVHVDNNHNIIVSSNYRIRVFTRDGDLKFYFRLKNGEDFSPVCAVKHNGLYYVSDRANNNIQVFGGNDFLPTKVSVIGKAGEMDGQLNDPRGLAIDNDHNLLVCDHGNRRIQKFTLDGRFVSKTRNSDAFSWIYHVAVLKENHFIATVGDHGVFIFQ